MTPLSNIVSVPTLLGQDAEYRTLDPTVLITLLTRCGVPHADEVARYFRYSLDSQSLWDVCDLLSYCTDFGMAQALSGIQVALGRPRKDFDFLVSLQPRGSSGINRIQKNLDDVAAGSPLKTYLESLGYEAPEPFEFCIDPAKLLDWVASQEPQYLNLIQSLKTTDPESFFLALVAHYFVAPLQDYTTLTQTLKGILYPLYSSAPLGSMEDQSVLGR